MIAQASSWKDPNLANGNDGETLDTVAQPKALPWPDSLVEGPPTWVLLLQ